MIERFWRSEKSGSQCYFKIRYGHRDMDVVMDLRGQVQNGIVELHIAELILGVGIDIDHDIIMDDEEAECEQQDR